MFVLNLVTVCCVRGCETTRGLEPLRDEQRLIEFQDAVVLDFDGGLTLDDFGDRRMCHAHRSTIRQQRPSARYSAFDATIFRDLCPAVSALLEKMLTTLVPGRRSQLGPFEKDDGPPSKRARRDSSVASGGRVCSGGSDVIWFTDTWAVNLALADELQVEKVIADQRTLRSKLIPDLTEHGVYLDCMSKGGSGRKDQFFYWPHALVAGVATSAGSFRRSTANAGMPEHPQHGVGIHIKQLNSYRPEGVKPDDERKILFELSEHFRSNEISLQSGKWTLHDTVLAYLVDCGVL